MHLQKSIQTIFYHHRTYLNHLTKKVLDDIYIYMKSYIPNKYASTIKYPTHLSSICNTTPKCTLYYLDFKGFLLPHILV